MLQESYIEMSMRIILNAILIDDKINTIGYYKYIETIMPELLAPVRMIKRGFPDLSGIKKSSESDEWSGSPDCIGILRFLIY